MLDRILSATGALAAFVPNAADMSDAYCDFLKRGYRCGQCNARPMNALGLVTASPTPRTDGSLQAGPAACFGPTRWSAPIATTAGRSGAR